MDLNKHHPPTQKQAGGRLCVQQPVGTHVLLTSSLKVVPVTATRAEAAAAAAAVSQEERSRNCGEKPVKWIR